MTYNCTHKNTINGHAYILYMPTNKYLEFVPAIAPARHTHSSETCDVISCTQAEKNNSDQTYCCPRDCRLLSSWGISENPLTITLLSYEVV